MTMFDAQRCNKLLSTIDHYYSLITLYDDTNNLSASESDATRQKRDRLSGITSAALPTRLRSAAAAALLYGDRRFEGGKTTAATSSSIDREGLTALPQALQPILSRGATYEQARLQVEQKNTLATRDTRIAASLSRAPGEVEAQKEDVWLDAIRLSLLLRLPHSPPDNHTSEKEPLPSTGVPFSLTLATFEKGVVDTSEGLLFTSIKKQTEEGEEAQLPHKNAQSLSNTILAVRDQLRRFEKDVDSVKEKASATIAYAETPEQAARLRAELECELSAIDYALTKFSLDSGLGTIAALHRARIISTYFGALEESESWLKGMATIHHVDERPLDPYEKTIIDDFIVDERIWASSGNPYSASTQEFVARTKAISDLRQQEQEHRKRKVRTLSDIDPGLLLHGSERNERMALAARRSQMMQHLARKALRLQQCAIGPAYSTGQRAKAEKVSAHALTWIGEIMENSEPHSKDRDGAGKEWGSRKRRPSARPEEDNTALSSNSAEVVESSSTLLGSSLRSHRLSVSVANRGFSRFVTTGAITGVDLLSRVTTEEIADQLARLQLALKETNVGAAVIARHNELDSMVDYVKSAIVNPTLRSVIDVEELEKILEDLEEWRERQVMREKEEEEQHWKKAINSNDIGDEGMANSSSSSSVAEEYARVIELLRSSASACGLSVLADYDAIILTADGVSKARREGGKGETSYSRDGTHEEPALRHTELGGVLATRTPAAGVVPSTEQDRLTHDARPESSATLFRHFTADYQKRLAKKREAPIYDAISDCCDIIEAVQQLRVHVRIKGRAHVPPSFLSEKVEPLQRELDSVLSALEHAGGIKDSDGVEKDALFAHATPSNASQSFVPPNATEVSLSANLPTVHASPEAEDNPETINADTTTSTANQKDEGSGLGFGSRDGDLCASLRVEGPDGEVVVRRGHPVDDVFAPNSAPNAEDTTIARLNAAADLAASLLREAKDVYGVSVPASCFILTHST